MMKSKKIVAALLSIGMLATSIVSVSASIEADASLGLVMISSMPEQTAVAARTPNVAVNVEKIANNEFATVDAVYNMLYASKKDTAGAYLYDMYKVTTTFTNLGNLAVGYDSSDSTKVGVGVIALKAYEDFGTTKANIVQQKNIAGGIAGYSHSVGFESTTSTVLNYEHYTSEVNNPYPFFGDSELGAIGADDSFVLTQLFVLNAGTTATFSLKENTGVTYSYIKNAVGNSVPAKATLPAENSFTLGTKAPVVNYPTAVAITNKPTVALNINDEVQLGATVTGGDEDKKTVTWTSSDATTVSVDSTGKIKALKATTTPVTITASVKTGAGETDVATDTVTITVNQPTPPAFKFTLGTSWNNASGYVWAGCKMENIGAGKTYTAKFSATGEADDYVKTLDLNDKEVEGTITFDVVLNTTKTGVTFNVTEN